jgi:RNA polymerase sigma-70 factor (ECF subfamily)
VADEAFIEAVYAEHGAVLLRYARRLVKGDRQKAEDLVQETIERAWLNADALARRRARPWLFAVARNLSVDAYRASLARPSEVGDEMLQDIPADDSTDRTLQALTVTQALRTLQPGHLAVIVELYYRRHTVAETAAALGIPAGTVKSRTNSALKQLSKALQERGVTGSVTA